MGMKDLSTPLSDEEMDRLDEFLLDRILEDDEDWEEKDEGILNISTLDGFFTAIVSSLHSIIPSQWMPAMWGDYEQIWDSQADAEEIISLMMRHMNGIVHFLMEEPENFEPMFLEREVDGNVYQIVDDWCEGYRRGMKLDLDYWNDMPVEIAEELIPIYLFSDEKFDDKLSQLSSERIRQFQDSIPPAVRKLHAHALKMRRKDMQVKRDAPKTGRNDPCPCGSGLKYKKCCGKSPILY
jgi:uncharacterized protein